MVAANETTAAAAGGWTREQIELIKRTIARGATDDELKLFLWTAQRMGLDPFARQISFHKRRQRRPDGEWEEVAVILVTIDGFRSRADASGKYAGQLGPYWCGPDGQWTDVWLKPEPPVAAKVGVLRTDFREPVWAVARYDAYCQRRKDGTPTEAWQRMPDVMLAKCAEALALRKAFPKELAGVYTTDEMGQAWNEDEAGDVPARASAAEELPKGLPVQASRPNGARPAPNGKPVAKGGGITREQLQRLKELLSALGWSAEDAAMHAEARYGVRSARELSQEQADDMIRWLEDYLLTAEDVPDDAMGEAEGGGEEA